MPLGGCRGAGRHCYPMHRDVTPIRWRVGLRFRRLLRSQLSLHWSHSPYKLPAEIIWSVCELNAGRCRQPFTHASFNNVCVMPRNEKIDMWEYLACTAGPSLSQQLTRGIQRHPRRRKMCHGNPRGTKIRKLGDKKSKNVLMFYV